MISPMRTPAGSRPGAGASTQAQVVYDLGSIAEEAARHTTGDGIPRALVMTRGKKAGAIIRDVAAAGMDAVVPFTQDGKAAQHLRMAKQTVCLGDTYSDALFSNAYAVLQAARDCNVAVILLADAALPLADVDSFLAHARRRGLPVYAATEAASPLGGWTLQETSKEAPERESWRTCRSCGLKFDERSLAQRYYECPACGEYLRLSSDQRINDLLDMGSFEEWDARREQTDPLDFPGYLDKLDAQREKTHRDEAVRTGAGSIASMRVAVAVMESDFFMGSMGSVVGDKVARLFDRATAERLPVIAFCCSGGARMQEGLVSLMQMAKVSCAVERHSRAGLLYLSIITDPTTGGVTASFATQGDIILAEPHALLGFAGKRVIQDTIRRELPEGFQTAEFALEHGLIDAIIPRRQLRRTLAQILALHPADAAGPAWGNAGVEEALDAGGNTYNHIMHGRVAPEGPKEERGIGAALQAGVGLIGSAGSFLGNAVRAAQGRHMAEAESGASLVADGDDGGEPAGGGIIRRAGRARPAPVDGGSAWESVQMARNVHRPTSLHYIRNIFDGFVELHGDRMFADDGAVIGGVGWFGDRPVTVIAQEKGENLNERVKRNFGCPQPEGYRKSLRLMRQAEKFGRPILLIVDTQGAYCGAEAEERGQGNAIADNLFALAGLRVPVISVLIGEGGSGGALALALSNRVAMQEHAVYSVLSPEGFASILWKDRSRAPEAAAVMRMDARQIFEMGIVDAVLSEGAGPAHENPDEAVAGVRDYFARSLEELSPLTPDELVEQRQRRFARF